MIDVKKEFNGKELIIETGKVARQSSGSVLVKHGDNIILATVNYDKSPADDVDFFPLTVDFIEKNYASGKIPGGFFKREAKPPVEATLAARMIDRPIRPLFPKGFRQKTAIVITVLSYDGETYPSMLGMLGASAALSISELPFKEPIAGVTVGRINGEFILNPTRDQLADSEIELEVAGTMENIMMIEAGAKGVSEELILDAIEFGHNALKELISLQEELVSKIKPEKIEVTEKEFNQELYDRIKADHKPSLKEAINVHEKKERDKAVSDAKALIVEALGSEDDPKHNKELAELIDKLMKETARENILQDKKRADGRAPEDIRPITGEINYLPKAHGSALFTRGETQSLGIITLGTKSDEQMIDSMDEVYFKKYYLHYNFPPFSVGEAGFMRGPGRRELGHGNLAERALKAVLPGHEDFPYTIRIVSEILESNGSSSMATVCSGSMALMAAGVPTSAPVAGIAMGLIKEGDDYVVLSDIMGLEDHLGDMDFKVAGTAEGITALQMDIKIGGITKQIMNEAMTQAKKGRDHILGKMAEAIKEPAKELAPTAPRIESFKIPTDKIAMLIGPGGKMIKKIIADFDVQVDIDDDGTVNIYSNDGEKMANAREFIDNLTEDVEVGEIYDGKVVKIMNFGAFIEVPNGTQGLCHISEVDHKRIDRVEDYLSEGDHVKVKCIGTENGKVNFSIKALKEK